jgi:hypothetical protein
MFVSMSASALAIAACGRQVTPNPKNIGAAGLSPGFMSVKFRVATAFNFQSDSYVIIFNTANTCATCNVTPVAEAVNTGFAGYSMAIVVGGQNGAVTAQAYSYTRPAGASQSVAPVLYPINPTQQDLQFTPNSNGLGTEFQVIFSRNIAEFNATATASPSASPSPGASPTAVPTGATVTDWWTYNFFTVQGSVLSGSSAQSLTIVDSLGQGGATDSTFQSQILDVATSFDDTFYTQAGTHPSTQDAITGGEIANAPLATASPSPSPSASASATATATV